MQLRVILVLAICRWTFPVLSAPTNNNVDNHIPNSEDNTLNQYTLPNFSSLSTEVDVNKTVEQVEDILKANPLLPRLSKEDIIFLLNNITTEDKLRNQQDLNTIPPSKELEAPPSIPVEKKPKIGKSLMVVLPYHEGDTASGDVAELYTKPPIIRYIEPIIVGDEDITEENNFKDKPSPNNQFKNHKYSDSDIKTLDETFPTAVSFWNDQAKKTMSNLKQYNIMTDLTKQINDLPFKKIPAIEIPDMFTKDKDQSIPIPESLVSETISQPNIADELLRPFKPMNTDDKSTNTFIVMPSSQEVPNGNINGDNVANPSLFLFTNNEQQKELLIPDTTAYAAFKPLPTDKGEYNTSAGEGLEELLERFGLLEPINKPFRPLNINTQEPLNNQNDYITNTDMFDSDILPPGMASILDDMGLTSKKGRKISDTSKKNSDSVNKKAKSKSTLPSETLNSGPDPLAIEELDSSAKHKDMKKRQESSSKSPETITLAPSSVSKASESSEGPALADLENSFGASPADDDPSEAQLPPPRKNGFYYMLDWNSFLEVGEGDTKVNIRFTPKLGDPQRFLAVTVP